MGQGRQERHRHGRGAAQDTAALRSQQGKTVPRESLGTDRAEVVTQEADKGEVRSAGGRVSCELCPHHCRLKEGQSGVCGGRACVAGVVRPINYPQLASLALDPIEKKPLKRFYPGSYILSAGTFGCNLKCPFCQNHSLSMARAGELKTESYTPQALCELALALSRRQPGNLGVAFTYNEPLISYEYLIECASLLREHGLKTVLVTNGTLLRPYSLKLLEQVDALNIDLKGFSEDFYRYVKGDLKTVLQFIEDAVARCHVEVTTLVIPGLNDDEELMRREARYLASLSPQLPLHLSRFFPRFKLQDKEPTPPQTILRLCEVASESLQYVYPGNI